MNPVELTQRTIEVTLDGNQPKLLEFGTFSTNFKACSVTVVELYKDQSKTDHTDIELFESNGQYTV